MSSTPLPQCPSALDPVVKVALAAADGGGGLGDADGGRPLADFGERWL